MSWKLLSSSRRISPSFLHSPLFLLPSFRDADGDVDTCPQWTFPTVRPTTLSQLQQDYANTESEVKTHTADRQTQSQIFLFSP